MDSEIRREQRESAAAGICVRDFVVGAREATKRGCDRGSGLQVARLGQRGEYIDSENNVLHLGTLFYLLRRTSEANRTEWDLAHRQQWITSKFTVSKRCASH